MELPEPLLAALDTIECWSYHAGGAAATEPTALAALALLAVDRPAAGRALDWLVRVQSADGSLGVSADEAAPFWPTSLAVLAWTAADESRYRGRIHRAVQCIIQWQGTTASNSRDVGHDTQITGWPWVQGTHSWVEPTAFDVLALRAVGERDHVRTREGCRLIADRLLMSGGCNYGNTTVLGQEILPHVQPTGIAMLALADRDLANSAEPTDILVRIQRALDYLALHVRGKSAAASLSFAVLGLAAWNRLPADYRRVLDQVTARTLRRGASPYRLALLAHAYLAERSPLVTLPQRAN